MSDTDTANRLPTAEEEARFWDLVEAAWERLGPEAAALRRALLTRDPAADDDSASALDTWRDAFLDQLGQLCADLSSPDLTDLDRVVERKLYDIDRADVHAVIDGSDDGFLYGRGHVVALGREFYEAVRADPTRAVPDGDFQGICYFFAHLHDQRFGDWPRTGSGISRESFSNPAGWAER
ncbi:DUF4240 domain-containing protein [Micromonospora sp. WMMD714]|uniref:DUF4240 domain-containing protein n=1 Tax=Micromonospora sp. WMMD714 TaxID=3016097 RepID=UPI002499E812|nr:DUF4240 domain-containing protein [Micromonospora sp. WMMD714]WFE61964.1 DUF4240 domain-containing protein [Micromonospora sp. WMMD714]